MPRKTPSKKRSAASSPAGSLAEIRRPLAETGVDYRKVDLRRRNRDVALGLQALAASRPALEWVACAAAATVALPGDEIDKRAGLLGLLTCPAARVAELKGQRSRAQPAPARKVLPGAEASMQRIVDGIFSWPEAAIRAAFAAVVAAGGFGELLLALERALGGTSKRAYSDARRGLRDLKARFVEHFDAVLRLSPEDQKHHVDNFVTAGRAHESSTEIELIASAALQRLARLVANPTMLGDEAVFRADRRAGSLTNLILGRQGPPRRRGEVCNNRNVINVLAAVLGQCVGLRFQSIQLAGEDLAGRLILHDGASNFTFDAASAPVSVSTVHMWQSLGVMGAAEHPAPLSAALTTFLIEYSYRAQERGDGAAAAKMARAALEIHPRCPAVYILAAESARRDRAIRLLERALEWNPRSYVARRQLYSHLRQAKKTAAMEIGEEAARIGGENTAAIARVISDWGVPPSRAELRELWMELAWLAHEREDHERESAWFRAARALDPLEINRMVTEEELRELLIAGNPKIAGLADASPGRRPKGSEKSWLRALEVGRTTDISKGAEGRDQKVLAPDHIAEASALRASASKTTRAAIDSDLARIRGRQADLARAIYIKALAARAGILRDPDADGSHATDAGIEARDDALATLRVFSGRLTRLTRTELLRRNVVTDRNSAVAQVAGFDPWDTDNPTPGLYTDRKFGPRPRDSQGLAQRAQGSCGPTTGQIVLAEWDPVRSWIVHDSGLTSLSATDAVGRFQAHVLLEYDSVPLSRLAALNWRRVKYGLGVLKRKGDVTRADAAALYRHVGQGQPDSRMSRSAARALAALRELTGGFPGDQEIRAIQKDPLEGEDGLYSEQFADFLNRYLSPVTGYRYRMILPPSRGGDPDVFNPVEMKRHLDDMASLLARQVAIPIEISEPGHFMLMPGMQLENGARRFLVTDPGGGTTRGFSESDIVSGKFSVDLFDLYPDQPGYINVIFLPYR